MKTTAMRSYTLLLEAIAIVEKFAKREKARQKVPRSLKSSRHGRRGRSDEGKRGYERGDIASDCEHARGVAWRCVVDDDGHSMGEGDAMSSGAFGLRSSRLLSMWLRAATEPCCESGCNRRATRQDET